MAFSASPIAADGRVYFASEDGDVFVAKAGPEYVELGKHSMNKVDHGNAGNLRWLDHRPDTAASVTGIGDYEAIGSLMTRRHRPLALG